ncbi:30S ribosomal protein S14 [Streptomyces chiangmaiensis]
MKIRGGAGSVWRRKADSRGSRSVAAVVARYAEGWARPQRITGRASAAEASRLAGRRELCRQPRDASATRVLEWDGGRRDRTLAFSTYQVGPREQAHAGHLPGVQTSGW